MGPPRRRDGDPVPWGKLFLEGATPRCTSVACEQNERHLRGAPMRDRRGEPIKGYCIKGGLWVQLEIFLKH